MAVAGEAALSTPLTERPSLSMPENSALWPLHWESAERFWRNSWSLVARWISTTRAPGAIDETTAVRRL